jgi:hypothetical protein
LVTVIGTPALACTRNTFLAMSDSTRARALYSFSVSTMWSATTATLIPEAATRYDSAERRPSCQCSAGSSTRSAIFSALRGSNPAFWAAAGVPA